MSSQVKTIRYDNPQMSNDTGNSPWKNAWQRLLKNKIAVAGGLLIILMIVASLLGPVVIKALTGYTYDYIPSDKSLIRAMPPDWHHWMGTDDLGRDMMARVLYGGRISLMVGLVATLISLVIGVTYGAIAGYFGGKTDNIMMRAVDVLYSLPYIILVVILLALFNRSLLLLFVALGAISWLTMARIVRGQVLAIKNQEFIEAARALGLPSSTIIFRHIVPNILGPVIVYATLTVPTVMLEEAFLSFLGLGVQAPLSSWGVLAADGAQKMVIWPWLLIFAVAALSLTLFSLNAVGDGLRDAFDPQNAA
ncbi:MAG TPA: ABC transporter permease [Blastocatellia bacterium]|nr:ABC transporter permease [Blastocatellia bacterium]